MPRGFKISPDSKRELKGVLAVVKTTSAPKLEQKKTWWVCE